MKRIKRKVIQKAIGGILSIPKKVLTASQPSTSQKRISTDEARIFIKGGKRMFA